jgi:hypothetical protein
VKGILHFRPKRQKQAAVTTAVAALAATALVLGSTQAFASAPVQGTDHGAVQITDTTTPGGNAGVYNSTDTLAWHTTEACPTNFTGSAALLAELPNQPGDGQAQVSGPVAIVTGNFSGTFVNAGVPSTIASLQGIYNDINGTTIEFFVNCYPQGGLAGTPEAVMDEFATVSANGSTFTLSNTPPAGPANTTVTVTAPSQVYAGQAATITATVTASANGTPQGTVEFSQGGTSLDGGVPVSLNSGGVATVSATFNPTTPPQTYPILATYTSSTPASWPSNTGTLSLVVNAAPTNAIPLTVTVPTTGTLVLTVNPAGVAFGTPTVTSTGLTSSATIPNGNVQVTDTRNTYPGWAVTGQDSAWTGGSPLAGTFSGNQLGWSPTSGTTAQGVTFGPAVVAGTTGTGGLATAQTLAFAPQGLGNYATSGVGNGYGVTNLGASLSLLIPLTAPPGAYTSTVTFTAIPSHA